MINYDIIIANAPYFYGIGLLCYFAYILGAVYWFLIKDR